MCFVFCFFVFSLCGGNDCVSMSVSLLGFFLHSDQIRDKIGFIFFQTFDQLIAIVRLLIVMILWRVSIQTGMFFFFLFSSCSLCRESNKFICAFEICNFWRSRDELVRDYYSDSMMERLAGCPGMFKDFFAFGGRFTSFLISQSSCSSKILLSFVLTASCKMFQLIDLYQEP